MKIFEDIKKNEIPLAIFSFIVGIVLLTILTIISLTLFPFTRIPRGKKVVFTNLTIGVKAISMGCMYRDFIENILGYWVVCFVDEKERTNPYFLYIHHKDLKKFPEEYWQYRDPNKCREIEQSISIDVEVRKSFLCAYLPAKVIGFRLIDEPLQWSK